MEPFSERRPERRRDGLERDSVTNRWFLEFGLPEGGVSLKQAGGDYLVRVLHAIEAGRLFVEIAGRTDEMERFTNRLREQGATLIHRYPVSIDHAQ